MFNKKEIVSLINDGMDEKKFINSVDDADLKYYAKYVQNYDKKNYREFILNKFYELVKSGDIKERNEKTPKMDPKDNNNILLLMQQDLNISHVEDYDLDESNFNISDLSIDKNRYNSEEYEEQKKDLINSFDNDYETKNKILSNDFKDESDIIKSSNDEENNISDESFEIEMDKSEVDKGINLSAEQRQAFEHIKNGESIFLTGSAGTGKSFCIDHIINWVSQRKPRSKIGLTSTTGCSALLIGGTTIHSFLGIGLGIGSAEILAKDTRMKKKRIFNLLNKLELLIIDEISMMSLELFDKISKYLSLIRDNEKPFGGLQLLLTGDFCQLSPVKSDVYCFESEIWKELNLKTIELCKSFRQSDEYFIKILKELRFGDCSNETYNILKKYRNRTYEDGIIPMKLFSTNKAVDKCNEEELCKIMKISKERFTYKIRNSSVSETKVNDIIKKNNISPSLVLCVGCQVMVTYNISISDGIVNGTIGRITQVSKDSITIYVFKTKKEFIIEYIPYIESTVQRDDIVSKILFFYLPVKLSYASTIHKVQGQTIDYLEVDLGSSIFTCGQAYTAISRIKKIEDINITRLSRASFMCDSKVLDFYKNNKKD